MAGDCLAVDALGLLGKELDERRAVDDFSLGFCQRLALLRCQDRCQIVGVFQHEFVPFAQNSGAFLACPRGPVLLCGLGRRNRLCDLCPAHIRDIGNHVTARWVQNLERAIVTVE